MAACSCALMCIAMVGASDEGDDGQTQRLTDMGRCDRRLGKRGGDLEGQSRGGRRLSVVSGNVTGNCTRQESLNVGGNSPRPGWRSGGARGGQRVTERTQPPQITAAIITHCGRSFWAYFSPPPDSQIAYQSVPKSWQQGRLVHGAISLFYLDPSYIGQLLLYLLLRPL